MISSVIKLPVYCNVECSTTQSYLIGQSPNKRRLFAGFPFMENDKNQKSQCCQKKEMIFLPARRYRSLKVAQGINKVTSILRHTQAQLAQ